MPVDDRGEGTGGADRLDAWPADRDESGEQDQFGEVLLCLPLGSALASDLRIALPYRTHQLPADAPGRAPDDRNGLDGRRPRLHHPGARPLDPTNLTRRFRRLLHRAGLRTIHFHGLRHSTATLLLEQGVDLVVIKELLGHAHIGVTATVYAHVRLRLQRQAIDTLGDALAPRGDAPDNPPAAAVVH